MDNRRYIPPDRKRTEGSPYGRRIDTGRNDSGYDAARVRRELIEKRSSRKRKQEEERRRKKRRRRSIRIRLMLGVGVTALLILILLFLTPLLNIRSFTISGNSLVTTEEIAGRLEGLTDKNLLLVSEKNVKGMLSDLSCIDDAEVSKYLIPPTVKIDIKESIPAARVELNGYDVVIDPNLKVLSDNGTLKPEALPRVEGLPVTKYSVGSVLTLAQDNDERLEVLKTALTVMSKIDMIYDADYIDLTDITSIRFGYDDRIDAMCGTRLELERKIRTFNVTVNNLPPNARGIIDLTETGKAVYNP